MECLLLLGRSSDALSKLDAQYSALYRTEDFIEGRRSAAAGRELTPIKLQLQWLPQAQFAGYYAAVKQGFYAKEGLNVTLKNGGPNIATTWAAMTLADAE